MFLFKSDDWKKATSCNVVWMGLNNIIYKAIICQIFLQKNYEKQGRITHSSSAALCKILITNSCIVPDYHVFVHVLYYIFACIYIYIYILSVYTVWTVVEFFRSLLFSIHVNSLMSNGTCIIVCIQNTGAKWLTTVRSRYLMVTFLQITHERHP